MRIQIGRTENIWLGKLGLNLLEKWARTELPLVFDCKERREGLNLGCDCFLCTYKLSTGVGLWISPLVWTSTECWGWENISCVFAFKVVLLFALGCNCTFVFSLFKSRLLGKALSDLPRLKENLAPVFVQNARLAGTDVWSWELFCGR